MGMEIDRSEEVVGVEESPFDQGPLNAVTVLNEVDVAVATQTRTLSTVKLETVSPFLFAGALPILFPKFFQDQSDRPADALELRELL